MPSAPWAVALALSLVSGPALAADIDDVATVSSAVEGTDVTDEQARTPRKRSAARRKARPSSRGAARPAPARASRPAPARRAPPRAAPARRVPARRVPVRRAGRPAPRAAVRRPIVVHRPVVRRVSPMTGVLVYGPPPRYHAQYRGAPGPVSQSHMPTRQVDRNNTVALGVKAGSLLSGTESGDIYTDAGLGLMLRYRPVETVGLQADFTHHAPQLALDSPRRQSQLAASVGLFAYSWTRVSPYVLGGVTWNGRSVPTGDTVRTDVLTGLHGGAGVQFGIGQRVGLELEGRYIGYLGRTGVSPLGALQGTAGLSFQL